jgi:hypothetical protein
MTVAAAPVGSGNLREQFLIVYQGRPTFIVLTGFLETTVLKEAARFKYTVRASHSRQSAKKVHQPEESSPA